MSFSVSSIVAFVTKTQFIDFNIFLVYYNNNNKNNNNTLLPHRNFTYLACKKKKK